MSADRKKPVSRIAAIEQAANRLAAVRAPKRAAKPTALATTPRALAESAMSLLRAQQRAPKDDPAAGGYGTALEHLGLHVPEVRQVTRHLGREVKRWPAEPVLEVVRRLIDSDTFEGRQLAYEVLGRHRAAREAVDAEMLEELAHGMDNWVTVDTLAAEVVGRAWANGQIDDRTVQRWARSEDFWWRRLALASAVALNTPARGGTGDAKRTFMLCHMLVADREDMVVKALSWALRSVIAHDAARVRAFMAEHGATLAPRVRREVSAKLRTGLKSGKRR